MEKQNSYSHILKYTGIFGGVQVLNLLVGLVRNKLVALILGPMGMGLIALFNSTIKMVGDSTNFGLSISAIRDISAAYNDSDTHRLRHKIMVLRHWSVLTALLGGVLCALLAPLLSMWTFSFGNHTLHFLLLSPVVALTTFTAGEMAILKATRRLNEVALSSMLTALSAIIVSVPVYMMFGYKGIVPSLLLMALIEAGIVVRFSLKTFPMRMVFRRSVLREGYGFIKLGTAFVLAGMAGSGAELGIRSFINYTSGVDMVGLYNAAYVMIFTYAGMVFTAMETDYYPRLSSMPSLGSGFNSIVNNQIEVSLNLVSPLLTVFILLVPMLLPALYSGKFMPVLPMLQVASLSMLARAMYLPIEYVSLSRGKSLVFLGIELSSYSVLIVSVILGYTLHGLFGAGVGIVIASMLEVIVVLIVCGIVFEYRMSASLMRMAIVHMVLCVLVYAVTLSGNIWVYCLAGGILSVADFAYSLHIMRKHVDVSRRIMDKIKQHFIRKRS